MECGKIDESDEVGTQDSEDDIQAEDESWKRVGGVPEEDLKGNEGQMEEDEATDDGREECRSHARLHRNQAPAPGVAPGARGLGV